MLTNHENGVPAEQPLDTGNGKAQDSSGAQNTFLWRNPPRKSGFRMPAVPGVRRDKALRGANNPAGPQAGFEPPAPGTTPGMASKANLWSKTMTDNPKPPETPGLAEVSPNFVDEAEAATVAPPSSASVPDDLLVALAVDYYAAYIARDAADDAREEAGIKAGEADHEATHVRMEEVEPGTLPISAIFENAGTLTPSREQVSRYSQHSDREDEAEAIIRHLEKYGESCIAAFEAQGWPEKQAEYQRAEQRMEAAFDQMVSTPAQGFRGLAAKMKGLVFPHEWKCSDDDEVAGWSGQIDTEMFASLVADAERLAGEGTAAVPVSVTEPEDAVVALRQRWESVIAERGQLKSRDDKNPAHPDVIEDARLHDIQRDIEESIAETPTRTVAGVAVKLRQLQRNETEFDGDAPWRPAAFRTALMALGRNTVRDASGRL